jgi:hypothetical protein
LSDEDTASSDGGWALWREVQARQTTEAAKGGLGVNKGYNSFSFPGAPYRA